MKLFTVSVEYAFVLAADSQAHADAIAYSYIRDVLSDCDKSTVDISARPYNAGDLCDWDDSLEPYNGDGSTTGEYTNE